MIDVKANKYPPTTPTTNKKLMFDSKPIEIDVLDMDSEQTPIFDTRKSLFKKGTAKEHIFVKEDKKKETAKTEQLTSSKKKKEGKDVKKAAEGAECPAAKAGCMKKFWYMITCRKGKLAEEEKAMQAKCE